MKTLTRLNSVGPRSGEDTWSRVSRLIDRHPDLKKVRLDRNTHGVRIGFYEPPSKEALGRIESAVRAELSGQWDVVIEPNGDSPAVHLHKIDGHTTEFHRAHPENEPPVIWKRITLPRWQNRPFPRAIARNHRMMLSLAGICGLTALCGFVLVRLGFGSAVTAPFFATAYLSGAWFATQDVWHALKRGKIDIQFLMIAVALGALFVNAATEGATLLFLFSLSNGLEQFANYRTRKSIEALLIVAPKQALRREGCYAVLAKWWAFLALNAAF